MLLKNGKDPKHPFLPLDKNAKKILVAGTHAANIGYQCGGWTITKYGHGGEVTIGMHFFCTFVTTHHVSFFRTGVLHCLWYKED